MGKHGNGVEKQDGGQTALDLEEEASAAELEAPAAEPEAPATEPEAPATEPEAPTKELEAAESVPAVNSVTELGNTNDACWKVLADGERVEISDKEWRKELTLMLAPSTTRAS